MKQILRSLYLTATSLSLVACNSISLLTFEQLQPAEVNFPANIRSVAVVDNIPQEETVAIFQQQGQTQLLKSVTTEAIAQTIADTKYFDEVLIADPPLATNVDSLMQALRVDMLLSVDRFPVEMKRSQVWLPEWGEIATWQTILSPVLRTYYQGRKTSVATIVAPDTLHVDLNSVNYPKEFAQEIAQHSANIIVQKLLPTWKTAQRFFFESDATSRDVAYLIKQERLEDAYQRSKAGYETQKAGKKKARYAYNTAVVCERIGRLEEAEEWIKTAEKEIGGIEGTEKQVIQVYKEQLRQRLAQMPLLNIQMNRF